MTITVCRLIRACSVNDSLQQFTPPDVKLLDRTGGSKVEGNPAMPLYDGLKGGGLAPAGQTKRRQNQRKNR